MNNSKNNKLNMDIVHCTMIAMKNADTNGWIMLIQTILIKNEV